MDPKLRKLQERQQEETAEQHATLHRAGGREFGSVDELLRHDAAQVQPPPAIAHRLNDSIRREPKPFRSWWSRWFSRRRSSS